MEKFIIASMRRNAGKTGVIIGIAKALKKKIGYMKPFGDRLLYRKKRFWDYDSALITNIFGLEEDPSFMSLGFSHSKLGFMHDEKTTKQKLLESLADAGKDKDIFFFEGGRDISYGISIHLDPLSVARYVEGRLILVVSGDEDTILDDLTLLKTRISLSDVELAGVIINQVPNATDFENIYVPRIRKTGLPLIGIIPYQKDLMYFTIRFLAERLFAKIIAGEENAGRTVKRVFIGAMTLEAALRNPQFKEKDKVVVASGDRTELIMEAIKGNTAGVVLTENIMPDPKVISEAARAGIPLLLVSSDIHQITRQIDLMDPLLTADDQNKINLWEKLAKKHLDLKRLG
ncbi:MAG: DRTGG domain-containing protein [Syntrophales bacterium]